MKSFLNRKLRLAFGVTMVTLLLMGAVSYRLMLISDESGGWVLHTNAVLIQIKDLLFSMESLEYNSRQFVLTGKESDLESYQASVIKVGLDEQAIRTLWRTIPCSKIGSSPLRPSAAKTFEMRKRSSVCAGSRVMPPQ